MSIPNYKSVEFYPLSKLCYFVLVSSVTDTCDRSTEDMIKEVRKFLSGVKGERRIVMVYFIVFAQEVNSNDSENNKIDSSNSCVQK